MRFPFLLFILFPQFLTSQTQVGQSVIGSLSEGAGKSVSISEDGKTLAIGSPKFNNDIYFDSGIVKVFELQNEDWVQKGQALEGQSQTNLFGYYISLAKNGERLLVASYFGEIKIYDFSQDSEWIEIGSFEGIENLTKLNSASANISKNGERIVFEEVDTVNHISKVRVYKFNNLDWQEVGKPLFEEEQDINKTFKYRSAMSYDGNTLHLSDVEFSSFPYNGNGKVCSFKYENESWNQLGECLIGEGIDDQFGFSLSTNHDGNILIVGGPSIDPTLENDKTVKVFEFKNQEWIQKGNAIEHENLSAYFGNDVEMSADGNVVAIAAHRDSTNGGFSGQVKLYEFIEDIWQQKGSPISGGYNEYCGESISLSADGTILSIGHPGYEIDWGEGQVKVYDYSIPLSTDKSQFVSQIIIQPNPSSDFIYISDLDSFEYDVFNQIGMKVSSGVYTKQIDVQNFPSGIYTVQAKKEDKLFIGKFFKK